MNELAERPRCQCGAYLNLRADRGSNNAMEAELGVWYDHPSPAWGESLIGHSGAVLLPKAAVLA